MTTTKTPAFPGTYPGEYKSAIAKAKKILVAAGFPWSVTTGRYQPYGNTQVTTRGIRVTRVGYSSTVALHSYGYTGSFSSALDGERRLIEALAIATLREAGMPFDDRGWLACGEDGRRAQREAAKAAAKAAEPTPEQKAEQRRAAERKRQADIVEKCDDALNALLDDTGPLYALPEDIRRAIRGDLDSAVRTLTACMEHYESLLNEGEN